jgi:hypothetical protein
MAIVAPDKIGFTGLGGSSITPRDTYARPAHQEADQTLGALADAASKMGVKFTQIGQQQEAGNEDLDRKKTDLYVAQAYRDVKAGGPVDAQINAIFPQQSPAIRADISRRLGQQRGQEWIAEHMAPVLQDPRALTDPNFVRTEMARLKSQAATEHGDDPFYGSGFVDGISGTGDGLAAGADSRSAEYYTGNARSNLAGDSLMVSTCAGGVTFKTVADTPDARLLPY